MNSYLEGVAEICIMLPYNSDMLVIDLFYIDLGIMTVILVP